ncbi:MAG TPA: aminotransferase class I/II-fold pyridoxal phosphate-dependent enzyme [Micromonosporaceae bacterium]|nr:aminotransferase class I/II-fold pyridoxal phosphate-dependent enzyme [Micromonosporaceae bacterium]
MNPLTELTLDQLRTRRSVKWQTHPADVLPMFIAEMDTPLAPALGQALSRAVERGDTGYAQPGGVFEAYADFARKRFDWAPDPAGMRLVPDVNTGIAEVIRALTPASATVVVDTPAYPPFFAKVRDTGRQLVEVPMVTSEAGAPVPDLDSLERAFAAGAAVYLMCNPHNPSGAAFSRETLLAIAALAERYGVRVLSDEIHGPLTYPGVDHVPFASLPTAASGASVTFVSASKAWNLPGLKAALVVPAPDAVEPMRALPIEVSFGSGLLGVIASEVAFADGGTWLDALRDGLDHNRLRLAARLREEVPEIGYRPPDATYLAWLDCRALDLGDDPATKFLEVGRVALGSGPTFGAPGTGFARLNFATSPELVDEAVRRIAATVRR